MIYKHTEEEIHRDLKSENIHTQHTEFLESENSKTEFLESENSRTEFLESENSCCN